MADTFVISDLHIGDGGPRDNFSREKYTRLKSFLAYVESESGVLIVLGDLFDFWQANFSRVLTSEVATELLDKLWKLGACYVVGNHDIDLVGFTSHNMLSHPLFTRLSGPMDRVYNGKRFHFMHGHEVDPYNSDELPGKGRALAILGGMAESAAGGAKVGGLVIENVLKDNAWKVSCWLKNICRKILLRCLKMFGVTRNEDLPSQSPEQADRLLAYYDEHHKKIGCDVLVTGHTHKPGHIGDWYVNSGSWAMSENFVRIKPDGTAKSYNWNGGAIEQCGEITYAS